MNRFVCSAALVAGAILAVAGAPEKAKADDISVCLYRDTKDMIRDADAGIAACTKLIESGALKGERLGYAYAQRAVLLGVKNDWKAATEDDDRAVSLVPADVTILVNRGVGYVNQKKYFEAIADLTKAIKMSPRFSYPYLVRGTAYLEMDRYDEALDDFRTGARWDPDFSRGRTAICLALAIKNQDLGDAKRLCDRAVKFTVNDPVPYEIRALLNLRLGKTAEALQDAETALRLGPERSAALAAKALAEQKLGRTEEARADASQADAKDPGIMAKYRRWGFPIS